ncbi:hypothetical protein SGGMMB4_05913 (plasmid) [Sodalis glossinidius str. 'morsitans']|uniref:DUF1640 domain-containing protein n=3 Tax=root TaxID=1 RepID=Q4LBR7_SODGL|nr:DUF1640 domain-containing protein [Sodalis glossinidius]AAG50256.1 unknown [Phage GMSE-1]CAI59418.1 hypothetical protein pSG4.02 [Sodalis glossinidius]CAI59431.1 hypothetical protein pSG4.02 [Sodalis glossinidius]CRL46941.1 hypothetical protein SGGMMB4_05913 [Sodalis glossinidius str. 'morsitans']BAE75785.1 hypothetical phage protein [Sodalis glossinidius str. 'morsitans']
MGQVAFDTQEFVEMLENAGLPKDQARAISIAVRKSHEVADVATRRDLEDARKDLSAKIVEARKDTVAQFEKTDAKFAEVKRDIAEVRKDLAFEIADARKEAAARADRTNAEITGVRKDMAALFEKNEAQIALLRREQSADIALVRKDMEALTNGLLIKLTKVMLGCVGLASAIVTIAVKFF